MTNIVSQTINILAIIEHNMFQNEPLFDTIEKIKVPIKHTPAIPIGYIVFG